MAVLKPTLLEAFKKTGKTKVIFATLDEGGKKITTSSYKYAEPGSYAVGGGSDAKRPAELKHSNRGQAYRIFTDLISDRRRTL